MPSCNIPPVRTPARRLLRYFLSITIVIVILLLHLGYFSGHEELYFLTHREPLVTYIHSWIEKKGNHHSTLLEHPIPKLMQDAETQYQKKLGSQSKTLVRAVAEYRRRYHHSPPKGFDIWFKFAQKHAFRMMDEFDGLMEDLKPFWELPGEEVRRRCKLSAYLPAVDIVRVEDGTSRVQLPPDVSARRPSDRARYFVNMTESFVQDLPDMEFPINVNAESRVAIPWESRQRPPVNIQHKLADLSNSTWSEEKNVWEIWRQTCPPESPARRPYASIRDSLASGARAYLGGSNRGPGRDFEFIKDASSSVDFCTQPYAHYGHGQFFSDWRTIPALLPIFSAVKAKGFMDIRIPSHYYYWSRFHDGDPVPWEEKVDKVFWRGSTGASASGTPAGFTPYYHRHRFLRMATDRTDMNRSVTYADSSSSSTTFVTTKVSIAKLNKDIMDAAFTNVSESESYPGDPDAMVATHRFDNPVPLSRHWSYRYLLDMDGTSHSGRFFAFLASDSVPIKSTVYDEFFSDWIQPWVHYIPLSTSYKEIYNVFAYFTGPSKSTLETANSTLAGVPISQRRSADGDRRLRTIARSGRQWKRTIGRPADMEVFLFRLCLEWARLWADDRDAMSFEL